MRICAVASDSNRDADLAFRIWLTLRTVITRS